MSSSLMRDVAMKGIARLGKKKLWQLVQTVRALPPPVDARQLRNSLRDLGVFMSDEHFAELCERYGASAVDVDLFMADFMQLLTPRRRYVVGLIVHKVDPDGSGLITFDALDRAYDVNRHPHAVAHRRDLDDLVADFFADLTDERGGVQGGGAHDEDADEGSSRTELTAEELRAYYVGISLTTASDEAFELRCIRSFSLDRPKLQAADDVELLKGSRAASRSSRLVTSARRHPLYTTTNDAYGKEAPSPGEVTTGHGRSYRFTSRIPPRLGGATSMNM